jgi:hypothetical protein
LENTASRAKSTSVADASVVAVLQQESVAVLQQEDIGRGFGRNNAGTDSDSDSCDEAESEAAPDVVVRRMYGECEQLALEGLDGWVGEVDWAWFRTAVEHLEVATANAELDWACGLVRETLSGFRTERLGLLVGRLWIWEQAKAQWEEVEGELPMFAEEKMVEARRVGQMLRGMQRGLWQLQRMVAWDARSSRVIAEQVEWLRENMVQWRRRATLSQRIREAYWAGREAGLSEEMCEQLDRVADLLLTNAEVPLEVDRMVMVVGDACEAAVFGEAMDEAEERLLELEIRLDG